MRRYATVTNVRDHAVLERYLPDNYRVGTHINGEATGGEFIIVGEDVAGWTLDDYVIPRLSSGLIWATEIAADDPRVAQIPPRFVVVENTPGYLPDAGMPVVCDSLEAAQEIAAEQARDAADWMYDDDAVKVEQESPTLWRVSSDRPNDLGRVVEIIEQA